MTLPKYTNICVGRFYNVITRSKKLRAKNQSGLGESIVIALTTVITDVRGFVPSPLQEKEMLRNQQLTHLLTTLIGTNAALHVVPSSAMKVLHILCRW